MMVCSCREWLIHITKLGCVVSVAWIHGFPLNEDFLHFKFCPWCGKELHIEGETDEL